MEFKSIKELIRYDFTSFLIYSYIRQFNQIANTK